MSLGTNKGTVNSSKDYIDYSKEFHPPIGQDETPFGSHKTSELKLDEPTPEKPTPAKPTIDLFQKPKLKLV
jgi:hypothetical protein